MEEKKYSIIGKVEIGTDEYRDLIEGLTRAKKDYDEASSRAWKESQRANDAEKKAKAYKEDLDQLLEFVNSSEDTKAKYALFPTEKRLKAVAEEGN